MGVKNYKLLNFYHDKSFKDVNQILYNHFFMYIIILLGFTVMAVSFLNRINNLFNSLENIFITCFILFPLIYLLVKSIYGLILLQDSYKPYHYILVTEYSLLFIVGYQIILLSFFHNNIFYCYESLFLVLIGFIFRRFKNKIILLLALTVVLIQIKFLSPYYDFNILIVGFTFLFTLFVISPIIFTLRRKIIDEIRLIEMGYKLHPDSKIKDYIS